MAPAVWYSAAPQKLSLTWHLGQTIRICDKVTKVHELEVPPGIGKQHVNDS